MNRTRLLALAWVAYSATVAVGAHVAFGAYHQHVRRILPTYDVHAGTLVLGASNMSRWPERSPDTYAATFGDDVTSAAKPGWTTEILLSHLPLATDADVIVLGDLGSPDLAEGRTPLDAALGARAVVRKLLATTDAEIVVVSLTPRNLWGADGCALVEDTNWWVNGLLGGWERVTIVDAGIPHDDAHYLDDMSHLSPEGYARLGEALRPVVGRRGPALIVAVTP